MKKYLVLFTLLFLLIGCSAQLEQRLEASLKENIQVPEQAFMSDDSELVMAPDMEFLDYNNEPVKISDFKGKYVLVNSWATWCPFCQKELVDFAKVQKEFGDDVVIIAINRAENLNVTKVYSDELGITNSLVLWQDPADEFYRAINGFSMPETIFVDKEGFIRLHKRGTMDEKEISEKIIELLTL